VYSIGKTYSLLTLNIVHFLNMLKYCYFYSQGNVYVNVQVLY